jgi:protein disulfide-isomerase A6
LKDCDAKCRNAYLKTLKTLADKYKKKMWGWLWSEAGAQPKVEEALDVGGFGYPALAAAAVKKMKFSLLKGSFSQDGINEFLRDLSFGKGQTASIKGATMPKIYTIDAWDGKDGQLIVEDDIDLSDVDLDSKDEL